MHRRRCTLLLFFFTLVTGPSRSLSLKLSDARVYEPQIRARLGTTAREVVVLKLKAEVPRAHRVREVHPRVHRRRSTLLLFFFITLKPRVEGYKRLWALNTSSLRNCCTFL